MTTAAPTKKSVEPIWPGASKAPAGKPAGTPKPYAVLYTGDLHVADIEVVGNHRKKFNKTALKELADNVARVGVLQPIVCSGDRLHPVLVAGERRLRAARLAGLTLIPARILDVTEAEAAELVLGAEAAKVAKEARAAALAAWAKKKA